MTKWRKSGQVRSATKTGGKQIANPPPSFLSLAEIELFLPLHFCPPPLTVCRAIAVNFSFPLPPPPRQTFLA